LSAKGSVSPIQQALVNALRALPVDKVRLSPGILVQVPLQFALFVENQLRRRIKNLASFRWPETGSESLLPFKICNLQIPYDEENTKWQNARLCFQLAFKNLLSWCLGFVRTYNPWHKNDPGSPVVKPPPSWDGLESISAALIGVGSFGPRHIPFSPQRSFSNSLPPGSSTTSFSISTMAWWISFDWQTAFVSIRRVGPCQSERQGSFRGFADMPDVLRICDVLAVRGNSPGEDAFCGKAVE
jgi:hypothetical protein